MIDEITEWIKKLEERKTEAFTRTVLVIPQIEKRMVWL